MPRSPYLDILWFKKEIETGLFQCVFLISLEEEGKGTALSSKVWELKNAKKDFNIKWSVVDRAFGYKPGAKMCGLCSSERMHIALGRKGYKRLPPDCVLLNKRSEIMGKC